MSSAEDKEVAEMLAACKPPRRELWWIPAGLVGGLVAAAAVAFAVVSMGKVRMVVAVPALFAVLGGVFFVFRRQAREQHEKARRRYDD